MDICPMNITKPLSGEELHNLNTAKTIVLSRENIEEVNTSYYKKDKNVNTTGNSPNTAIPGQAPSPGALIKQITLPNLTKRAGKGQKLPLDFTGHELKINFGWNVKNPECDVDVSAFMLDKTGKVVGDDYFVFYGQEYSPEKSIVFKNVESREILESFDINIRILNPEVQRIVFVMTINEALTKGLNFGMLKDAYIQIAEAQTNRELASFLVEEYYTNIISMMMGEIYLHNGAWKFNAVGNGVNKDLTGLCELYGVQVI